MELINKDLKGTSTFVLTAAQVSARFKKILKCKNGFFWVIDTPRIRLERITSVEIYEFSVVLIVFKSC